MSCEHRFGTPHYATVEICDRCGRSEVECLRQRVAELEAQHDARAEWIRNGCRHRPECLTFEEHTRRTKR